MSQRAPLKPRASYEDVLRAPAHLVAEILDGDLYTTPRPAAPHAHTSLRLSTVLGGPFDEGRGGPGGWIILFEPELHLHQDIVVPDLAAWRRDRLPTVPDVAFLTLPPDWVCEILSPSTERLDRLRKLRIYAREGLAHLWLVNPLQRTLEALRLDKDRWMVTGTYGGDEEQATIEPFDAVPFELTRIWPG